MIGNSCKHCTQHHRDDSSTQIRPSSRSSSDHCNSNLQNRCRQSYKAEQKNVGQIDRNSLLYVRHMKNRSISINTNQCTKMSQEPSSSSSTSFSTLLSSPQPPAKMSSISSPQQQSPFDASHPKYVNWLEQQEISCLLCRCFDCFSQCINCYIEPDKLIESNNRKNEPKYQIKNSQHQQLQPNPDYNSLCSERFLHENCATCHLRSSHYHGNNSSSSTCSPSIFDSMVRCSKCKQIISYSNLNLNHPTNNVQNSKSNFNISKRMFEIASSSSSSLISSIALALRCTPLFILCTLLMISAFNPIRSVAASDIEPAIHLTSVNEKGSKYQFFFLKFLFTCFYKMPKRKQKNFSRS